MRTCVRNCPVYWDKRTLTETCNKKHCLSLLRQGSERVVTIFLSSALRHYLQNHKYKTRKMQKTKVFLNFIALQRFWFDLKLWHMWRQIRIVLGLKMLRAIINLRNFLDYLRNNWNISGCVWSFESCNKSSLWLFLSIIIAKNVQFCKRCRCYWFFLIICSL